jgi:hypothetical protein
MRLKGKRHEPRFHFSLRSGPCQTVDGSVRITASVVPGEQRMDFLPQHFGERAMIKFEMSVYDWMGLYAVSCGTRGIQLTAAAGLNG